MAIHSRRAPLAGAAAFLVLASCGGNVNVVQKQGLQLKPVEFPLRTFAYPSGLRVIVEKDSRTPLAGIFVVVGSGSSSDPAGKEGLAHYVEHLAFRTRAAGSEAFSDQLDRAGAVEHNAMTGWDATTYYEIGVAAALPDLLRLEVARMVFPASRIPDAERSVELDVVHNELRQRNETGFVGDVLSQLQAAVFPKGHPYARAVVGSHESLASITQADVDAFVRAHYRPANMTLVIVGDVDLQHVDQLLADTIPEQLAMAPAPVKLPERLAATPAAVPMPPAAPAKLRRAEASIGRPELWVAWSLPRAFDRDGYLLTFLEAEAGRRLARIRTDDADVAAVDVMAVRGVEASMLLCRISLFDAVHPESTLASVLGEAPKIPNGWLLGGDDADSAARNQRYSVGEVVFSRVRRYALVQELLEAQDLRGRGLRRAQVTHFSQDAALFSRAIHDLAEIKPERLADYARPYLTAERGRAVLFVPAADAPGGRVAQRAVAAALSGAGANRASWPAPPRNWIDALAAGAPKTETYRLANGLTVVLERRPGMPLLTAGLTLGIGAAAQQEGGAATMFRVWSGGSRFNDTTEYGGALSRSEGADSITYVAESASGNAEVLLASLAEAVRSQRLDHSVQVGYDERTLPRILRNEDDAGAIARRAFLSSLLPNHPYGHVPHGDELKTAIGPANAFISRTHSPANATLAIVGDFDPVAMGQFVSDSFGGWTGGAQPLAPPPPPAPSASAVRFVPTTRIAATQGELRFGCLLEEAKTGAVAARHHLAAQLLQDRLFRALRERAGATYGASARAVTLQGGTAWLELTADIENDKLTPALEETRRTLSSLAAAPPSEQELSWLRLERASNAAVGQLTNRGAAADLLARARLGYPAQPADELRELASVTAEDVRADFQRCLTANPTVSLLGDDAVIKAAWTQGWKP